MKNQYFGDIYDYVKYGLLRRLSDYGESSTALCWMMTPNDDGGDGGRTGYLEEHESWRDFDPDVFDCLTSAMDRGDRDTRIIERSGLLPNTRFYSHTLTDNPDTRQAFMDGFLRRSKGRKLVCFDPDNGLEVKTKKPGRKDSSKYLYMPEVSRSYGAGHSLLIFQNTPREKREAFIQRTASRLSEQTGSNNVYSFHVCKALATFFLVSQDDHYSEAVSKVEADWGEKLETIRHPLSGG